MKQLILPAMLLAAAALMALKPKGDDEKTVTPDQKQSRKINFLKA